MKKTIFFALFLMVTGVLVSAIAFYGYNYTKPFIDANIEKRINESVALLFDPTEGYTRNGDQPANKYQEEREDFISGVYEVLDSDKNVHAVIYDVSAQGRNAMVYALIAIDPYTDEVVGVVYYDHAETPNLGEKYTRQEHIDTLIGQNIDDVTVDAIAGATTTWGAIDQMFSEIERHYVEQEVHIDG